MFFLAEGEVQLALIVAVVVFFVITIIFLASRYKRCPSDKILVVFGKVGAGQSARCIHGGGVLVWPLIQDCEFISLTPMTISIPLQNALSLQNIRIHVPSTFTVGISTQPAIMANAAERLLGIRSNDIEEMAAEIIFGQLRLTVASLTIEQINQDRERFLESIRQNVEPELNKIGLYLINVNITDITDESDYINSIGKRAAAEATNQAMVDVAQQTKIGAIGQAAANREKEIEVAKNAAESAKGQKEAEADERIFVQKQESLATIGEAEAQRVQSIKVAEANAEAAKGTKTAEADKRIHVHGEEANAIKGENEAKARIADAEADLAVKRAAAKQLGEVAAKKADVEIQKALYLAESERLRAEEIARKEIDKQKIEIAANAEAEKIRAIAQGKADAIKMRFDAEATGTLQVLDAKASGYQALIKSCNGDTKAAATLLMVEKIEDLVQAQVEAVKNLKIDKITVWDSGGGNGDGRTTTSNFLSGMVHSLPPLQELADMAGVDLPDYLGKLRRDDSAPAAVKKGPEPTTT